MHTKLNYSLYFLRNMWFLFSQAGVLWHLLLFLFNYDYTLDESGVEKSAETNQQVRIKKEDKRSV